MSDRKFLALGFCAWLVLAGIGVLAGSGYTINYLTIAMTHYVGLLVVDAVAGSCNSGGGSK